MALADLSDPEAVRRALECDRFGAGSPCLAARERSGGAPRRAGPPADGPRAARLPRGQRRCPLAVDEMRDRHEWKVEAAPGRPGYRLRSRPYKFRRTRGD